MLLTSMFLSPLLSSLSRINKNTSSGEDWESGGDLCSGPTDAAP